jgi:hypothetical protein
MAYIRKINLLELYPTEAAKVMEKIAQTIIGLIPQCDSTTIHIPIEVLTYLSKISEDLSRNVLSA